MFLCGNSNVFFRFHPVGIGLLLPCLSPQRLKMFFKSLWDCPNPRLTRPFSVPGSTRASRVVVGALADHILHLLDFLWHERQQSARAPTATREARVLPRPQPSFRYARIRGLAEPMTRPLRSIAIPLKTARNLTYFALQCVFIVSGGTAVPILPCAAAHLT